LGAANKTYSDSSYSLLTSPYFWTKLPSLLSSPDSVSSEDMDMDMPSIDMFLATVVEEDFRLKCNPVNPYPMSIKTEAMALQNKHNYIYSMKPKQFCGKCDKAFSTKFVARPHELTCQGPKTEKTFVCEDCSQKFCNKRSMMRHIKICNDLIYSQDHEHELRKFKFDSVAEARRYVLQQRLDSEFGIKNSEDKGGKRVRYLYNCKKDGTYVPKKGPLKWMTCTEYRAFTAIQQEKCQNSFWLSRNQLNR
jgi:hypothetical protein